MQGHLLDTSGWLDADKWGTAGERATRRSGKEGKTGAHDEEETKTGAGDEEETKTGAGDEDVKNVPEDNCSSLMLAAVTVTLQDTNCYNHTP